MIVQGSTVGTYRVLHKLGEGGMGVVWVGEHTLLGRKAAIKVLLPELSANKEIVHRFFNEAKAVTQIADPGIVQVFDFGYDATGNAYIVMELLEGEPMDKRLDRIGRFSPTDCVRLMRQICSSLHAAHAKGIIHRDLKPENVFIVGDPAVTGGERAKILDFGIAKLSSNEPNSMKTRTGMVMGTPVYMSPEQCRGAGVLDHRSDIYSIACVMMTMLTGQPPFAGSGSGELIVQHMQAPPPLAGSRIAGLHPIVDQILQKCLAKDAAARFQSMAELAQALGHAEQTLYLGPAPDPYGASQPGYTPTGPTPPPGMYYPQPTTLSAAASQPTAPPSSRRGLMAAIGVAGLAAAVTIGVLATRGRGGDQPTEAGSGSAEVRIATPPAQRDAAPAPVAADSAPATPVVGTTAVDAGVVDAAAVVEVARDAGAKRPVAKVPKHIPTGRPTDTGSATPVDRGD